MTQEEQNEIVDQMRDLAQRIGEIKVETMTSDGISAVDALRQYGENAVPRAKKKILQEEFQILLVRLLNESLTVERMDGNGRQQSGGTWG